MCVWAVVCVCVGGGLTCSAENSSPWNFDTTMYGFSLSSYQATGHKKSRGFARPFAPTVTMDTQLPMIMDISEWCCIYSHTCTL